ncbi:MAG: helix-turn-helix transcriptional regulator [Oscillospiraceae bacterium]|nr:helix-turn-helix transcriptional regulator [Oscillospiraceae bacterium]
MLDIRTIRLERGMSQSDLACRVGTTQAAISRYEMGERSLDLAMAVKIAGALGCKVDDLVKYSWPPSP